MITLIHGINIFLKKVIIPKDSRSKDNWYMVGNLLQNGMRIAVKIQKGPLCQWWLEMISLDNADKLSDTHDTLAVTVLKTKEPKTKMTVRQNENAVGEETGGWVGERETEDILVVGSCTVEGMSVEIFYD